MLTDHLLGLTLACLFAFLVTPIVRKIAFRFQIVDKPNPRKVHKDAMPYLGGVAIYSAFVVSYILLVAATDIVATNLGYALLLGGLIIVVTGVLDDKFDLSPKYKLIGQLLAAGTAIYFGLEIHFITIPFTDTILHVGWFGLPLTLLWIVAITNAINLIDGLDGLASGVSGIAFLTLFFLSLSIGNVMTAFTSILLVGSILGFLYYNFFPAKIFMGDSGSLFLGYALSVISLLELKEATLLSFIVPIVVLGVPISDSLYAVIRRRVNNQPITSADKNHLHHCLLAMGLSHRNTVLVIYAMSLSLSAIAIFLSHSTLWISLLILFIYLVAFEFFAETIGLLSTNTRPLRSFIGSVYRKITCKRK